MWILQSCWTIKADLALMHFKNQCVHWWSWGMGYKAGQREEHNFGFNFQSNCLTVNSWKPFCTIWSIEYKALCLAVALLCAWRNFCVFLLSKNLLGFFLFCFSRCVCLMQTIIFYSAVIPFMLSFLKKGANICYVMHENCWECMTIV